MYIEKLQAFWRTFILIHAIRFKSHFIVIQHNLKDAMQDEITMHKLRLKHIEKNSVQGLNRSDKYINIKYKNNGTYLKTNKNESNIDREMLQCWLQRLLFFWADL